MQLNRYTGGGFGIHKIKGSWKGNVSAYYDSSGQCLDAEQTFVSFGPSRPVKRDGPIWRECVRLGKRHAVLP